MPELAREKRLVGGRPSAGDTAALEQLLLNHFHDVGAAHRAEDPRRRPADTLARMTSCKRCSPKRFRDINQFQHRDAASRSSPWRGDDRRSPPGRPAPETHRPQETRRRSASDLHRRISPKLARPPRSSILFATTAMCRRTPPNRREMERSALQVALAALPENQREALRRSLRRRKRRGRR